MTTSKTLLRTAQLYQFRLFCEFQGWVTVSKSGAYEVLRMRKSGSKHPLIVYRRDRGDFLTVTGNSFNLALAFVEHMKSEKQKYKTLGIKPSRPRPLQRANPGSIPVDANTSIMRRGWGSALGELVFRLVTTVKGWF